MLDGLPFGKPKKIRGHVVCRDDDGRFTVDGESIEKSEVLMILGENTAKSGGLDYERTAFIEKPQHSSNIIKIHKVGDKANHAALVEFVKERGNHLWYGTVVKIGYQYKVRHPLILDFDSVTQEPGVKPTKKEQKPVAVVAKPWDVADWDGGLSCPFCGQPVNSTPGRTLHVKHAHADKLQEYFAILARFLSNKVATAKPLEDDIGDMVSDE
jgi:hypothetical protein